MQRWLCVAVALALVVLAGCGSGGNKTRKLGSTSFNDHGTKSAQGKGDVELEVDNYYFEPTFLHGDPGSKLQVRIKNDSGTTHNFSVPAQNIDTDIRGKGNASVTVTVPQSGVVAFFCKFHTGQGMNGELLAGNAAPQAVNFQAPAASPGPGEAKPTKVPAYPY